MSFFSRERIASTHTVNIVINDMEWKYVLLVIYVQYSAVPL